MHSYSVQISHIAYKVPVLYCGTDSFCPIRVSLTLVKPTFSCPVLTNILNHILYVWGPCLSDNGPRPVSKISHSSVLLVFNMFFHKVSFVYCLNLFVYVVYHSIPYFFTYSMTCYLWPAEISTFTHPFFSQDSCFN